MALTILIVDDQPVNLKLLRFALGKSGHRVIAASNGAAALAELAADRPDIILLDLQMPGMSGFELAGRIKGTPEYNGIPIVAVTAYAMLGDERKALAAGCDAYVTKPIDMVALRELILRLAGSERNCRPPIDANRVVIPETGRRTGAVPPAGLPEPGHVILVAEDDAVNRKIIRWQLAVLGMSADIASNGTEALELWRHGNYGLLLTDLHMPGMDGYALCEAIRREEALLAPALRPGRLPILALTANAMPAEPSRARAAGLDDHLTKPLVLEQLSAALRRWLPGRQGHAGSSLPPVARGQRGGGVVDLNELRRHVGTDEHVLRDILTEFSTSTRALASELEAAVSARDGRRVAAIAHQLKSACRSIGAFAFGDVCVELENAGAGGDSTILADRWTDFQLGLGPVLVAVDGLLGQPLPSNDGQS